VLLQCFLFFHEFIFICFFFSISHFHRACFFGFFGVFFADFMFGKVVLSCAFIEEQRLNGSNVRQSSEKERADGEPKKIAREFVKISSDSLAKSTTSTTSTIFLALFVLAFSPFFLTVHLLGLPFSRLRRIQSIIQSDAKGSVPRSSNRPCPSGSCPS
jgi:hypothetical protein